MKFVTYFATLKFAFKNEGVAPASKNMAHIHGRRSDIAAGATRMAWQP